MAANESDALLDVGALFSVKRELEDKVGDVEVARGKCLCVGVGGPGWKGVGGGLRASGLRLEGGGS